MRPALKPTKPTHPLFWGAYFPPCIWIQLFLKQFAESQQKPSEFLEFADTVEFLIGKLKDDYCNMYRAFTTLQRQLPTCIIYPELHSTLEWQRAQVSDLSHVLIHHTNDCTQSAGCIIVPEPTLEWQSDTSVGPELCINTPYK